MEETLKTQVDRRLEPLIRALLSEEPVVVVQGARTVGKSTVVRAIARELGTRLIDLDDPTERDTASADPGLVVGGQAPVVIDEFQRVPVLADSVKAELNRRLEPGRFLLTGSARSLSLPWFVTALAGRAHVVTLWPLSQGELHATPETFLDVLIEDPGALAASAGEPDRESYMARMCAGGFPIPLSRGSDRGRSRWFDDYATMVTTQDAGGLRRVRSQTLLRDLLSVLADRTAQLLNVADVARVLGLDKSTCADLVELLEAVFCVHRLPAWGRTLTRGAVAHPKVHMVDTGLACFLTSMTTRKLASKEASAFSRAGHLLETFVVNEIHKQSGWSQAQVRLAHFRTHDGAEADLVVEASDGRVSAVEVKAGTRIRPDDCRGLRRLRDKLGARFVSGVVLYTGRAHRIDDRMWALPIGSLWSQPA